MVRGSGSRHTGERPVSNAADSQLMSQFNVEVDQHLEAIEPLLGSAEPDALKRSDIDLLFREFHSIKGLARLVGAPGMEALAHEAESLLSPVRSGDRAFDATIQEPLFTATDALRDALAEPLGWQPPAMVIEALRAATAAIAANGTGERSPASAGNEPWRFLGDDLDLLRAFAELLDEIVPEAAQAIVNQDDDGLAEATGAIIFACTRLGFDRRGTGVCLRQSDAEGGPLRRAGRQGLRRDRRVSPASRTAANHTPDMSRSSVGGATACAASADRALHRAL
jgi:HPt (histidine-containing phosphotransfer) domain-containing protein